MHAVDANWAQMRALLIEEHVNKGGEALCKLEGALVDVGRELGMDMRDLEVGIRKANVRKVMESETGIKDDTDYIGDPNVHDPAIIEAPYHHCPLLKFRYSVLSNKL